MVDPKFIVPPVEGAWGALFVDPKANVEEGVLTLLSVGAAAGVDPNEKPTLGASFLVSVVAWAGVDPNENGLGAADGVALLESVGAAV